MPRSEIITQEFTERHETREEAPAGGLSSGLGFEIGWQDGPVDDGEMPNGAFIETVIRACIGRLVFFQSALDGKFACQENERAILALHAALGHIQRRQRNRLERGALGTSIP